MTVVLGVDPGVSGALAWLSTDGKLDIADMPTVAHITSSGKERRYVNPETLIEILGNTPNYECFVEKQWGQKGDGAIQAFSLGHSYGCLLTALSPLIGRPQLVAPITWKRWLKVPEGKAGGLHRARELFPAYSRLFARKKDHGRADAALIALWGMAQIGKVKLSWLEKERAAAF